MALEKYRKMRDFAKTAEPRGSAREAPREKLSFVVQEHWARRHHFDFRLELDGVLKSWAIPKGPSNVTAERRLAVHVEDHPLEYGSFRGEIPEGEYGAGKVAIWDKGTWRPEGDPRADYRKGRLSFELFGKRLHGKWTLVRMKGRDDGDKENWLLIKRADRVRKKGGLGESIEIGGVEITNPDRVLYPEQGITKRRLAEYYEKVAEHMLPHLIERPLMLLRCPEGRQAECWHQKHASNGMPPAVRTVEVGEARGKGEPQIYVDSKQGLLSLAQMGALEIHTWGSRIDRLDFPDRMIFDIDPAPDVSWPRVLEAAQEIKERLDALRLESFVKTTGGKGLHIVVPIAARTPWEEVRDFAHAIVLDLVRSRPKLYLDTAQKSRRAGKIYLDYLRNGRGATSIALDSTRSREGAPVSTAVSWKELRRIVDPLELDMARVEKRLARAKTDPWDGFFEVKQSLQAVAERARARRISLSSASGRQGLSR